MNIKKYNFSYFTLVGLSEGFWLSILAFYCHDKALSCHSDYVNFLEDKLAAEMKIAYCWLLISSSWLYSTGIVYRSGLTFGLR